MTASLDISMGILKSGKPNGVAPIRHRISIMVHATRSRPTGPPVIVPVSVALIAARPNDAVISTALVPAIGREHGIRAAIVLRSSTLVEHGILDGISRVGSVIWELQV